MTQPSPETASSVECSSTGRQNRSSRIDRRSLERQRSIEPAAKASSVAAATTPAGSQTLSLPGVRVSIGRVYAGGGLAAPRAVERHPLRSGVDRRRLDKARDCSRQFAVGRDEDVRLQLRQRHELGVIRRLPTQLIRDLPRRSLKHLVAEEANLQRVDPRHPLEPFRGRDLTAARRLVQRRQRLRADERRRDELVLGGDLDLPGRNPEQRVAVDDEPGHSALRPEGTRKRASRPAAAKARSCRRSSACRRTRLSSPRSEARRRSSRSS